MLKKRTHLGLNKFLLVGTEEEERRRPETGGGLSMTPRGCVAVYVGEECRRFVVPARFLSHPLLKMVLEKTHKEFGFDQKNELVLPFTVSAFQEILNTVQANHATFHFGQFLHEFI